MMLRWLVAGGLAAAVTVPAFAKNDLDVDLDLGSAVQIVSTAVPSTLPVRIDACYSDGRGAKGLTFVHHSLNVTNTGSRPISALHVKFTFYDTFDEVASAHTNVADVTLAAGASQKSINLAEWSEGGQPARITCTVDAIRYADGTVAKT